VSRREGATEPTADRATGGRVLIVDDDDGVRYTLARILEDAGIENLQARNGAEALALLRAGEVVQLVISDLRMAPVGGLELLETIQRERLAPRVVMITAHGSERSAVEAMKLGAYDYFRKPFEIEQLVAVVRRALDSAQLAERNEQLAGERALSESVVFRSAPMSRLALLVARVAPRDVTVLLTGESGTGKERVAEALVRASGRATRPFVRFNCAALTAELAEAELFGHTKGAFTGAQKARNGLFREANTGTLLLDEIGELDPTMQAKLLRVLQEREVRPVGEDRALPIDVRILAATHRDLPKLVAEGRFREDLYYRLKVVELRVPPLRERLDDVPILARLFLARFAARFGIASLRVPDELPGRLMSYAWPGNVRELENAMESLVALSADGVLDLELLPGSPTAAAAPARAGLTLKQRVDAYERGLLVNALDATKGNRRAAARLLGTSRATLFDKLRKHELGLSGPGGADAGGDAAEGADADDDEPVDR
jgi:two-component system response regulator HydG